MDTSPPAGHMDTAPPAGHMDTAPPAGRMNTAPPAGHMDTAPSAGHMDTALPAEHMNIAPPAGHMDTAPPAGHTDTAPPAGHMNTAPPAGHMVTAPATGHMDTAPPAGHMVTAPATGHMDTAPPAGHMDTAPPAGHMNTAPPAGHMVTVPATGHMDTAPPAGHMETASPAGHMETASPAGHMETASPAGHMNTAPPAGHMVTAPATGHMDTAPPAGHMVTAPPAGHMDTAPATDHMDTAPPAGHMDTAPPAGHMDTASPENDEEWEVLDAADAGGGFSPKSVGIFYWAMDTHMKSLLDRLVPITGPYSAIPFSFISENEWKQVQRYSVVLVIYSSQTGPSSMKSFLDFYSRKHGAENMIKVIIDSEDAESQEGNHSEWGQSPPCPQVTLTAAELDVISPSDDVSIGRIMAEKVKAMRKILQVDADNSLLHHFGYNKPVIGIFSREAKSQYCWLMSALRSHPKKDDIAEVRPCCITNSGLQQFYQDLSHCQSGILYHSKNRGRINVTDVVGALYDEELKDLSSRLGKNNVIVVIDDLEDSSDQEKCRILSHQPSIGTMSAGLFLISLKEKTSNYQRYLMVNREEVEKKLQKLREMIRKMTAGEKAEKLMISPGAREKSGVKDKRQKKSKSREDITRTASGADRGDGDRRSGPEPAGSQKPRTQPEEKGSIRDYLSKRLPSFSAGVPFSDAFNKKTIGIFSRSLESEYSWLKMLLESQDFSNCVQSVRSCPVTNVFSDFWNEVTHCKFGILYHSKNRGRINVTDVTDSLYDEELELLSSRFGKKNVLVVIDDLEDTSDAMKNKLLRAQHSIEKLAQDLILVERSSSEEKRRATRDALKKVFQWPQGSCWAVGENFTV